MATGNVASSVDVLSSGERKLIVESLQLKAASLSRAIKASSNDAVSAAYEAEKISVEALIVKFR